MANDDTTPPDDGSRKSVRQKQLRSKIQKQIDQQREEQRREMLRKRIELAKNGLAHYEAKRFAEALNAFHTYLRIVEDWKEVPAGGLTPAQFDKSTDVPELLLINSIYWNLSKLYDGNKHLNKNNQFGVFLGKFILFSKGMPFEALVTENLRRFMLKRSPVHKAQFREAYQLISGRKCFIANSLFDEVGPGTIDRLQAFRDGTLRKSAWGRKAIGFYYRNGPRWAGRINRWPDWARRFLARALDVLARAVSI